MLAEIADRPFSREGWLFEPKLDGYRVLAVRAGRRRAAPHPERQRLQRRVSRGPARGRGAAVRPRLLLDGEVVALDDAGRPSFQRLQGRARLRAADRHPPCDGAVPGHLLRLRPARLRGFRPARLPLTSPQGDPATGPAACRRAPLPRARGGATARCSTSEAERLGLEGIVGKKAAVTLQGGTLPPLAQGPRPPERRLRGGRLHRPQGLARWVRRAAPGRFRGRHADLRRPRRQRLHRPPARRRASSAGGERPAGSPLRRTGAGREGDRVGRAHDGRRGRVHRADRRGPAPAAGLSPVPRRQASGGMHPRGHHEPRGGRAAGRRAILRGRFPSS